MKYEGVCTMVGGWAHVIPTPQGRSRESWEQTRPIESIYLLDATSLERGLLARASLHTFRSLWYLQISL